MAERPTKAALVLLGGELIDFVIHREDWALIVAADSGARHALERNLLPDHVVGDFDSLPPAQLAMLQKAGVGIETLRRDKDLTDGEAAVDWALASGAGQIVIAGGLGGRFDHTLGNVMLLHRLRRASATGWLTDGRQQVYLLCDRLTVPGAPGDQLSLVPLTPTMVGVHARGVRWPLHDATVEWGSTRTLSNEFIHPRAELGVSQGMGLVIVTPARYASM